MNYGANRATIVYSTIAAQHRVAGNVAPLHAATRLNPTDGADATRLAIGAADDHPLSVPALTRQAIKRLQRTVVPVSKLACSSAADPQRR